MVRGKAIATVFGILCSALPLAAAGDSDKTVIDGFLRNLRDSEYSMPDTEIVRRMLPRTETGQISEQLGAVNELTWTSRSGRCHITKEHPSAADDTAPAGLRILVGCDDLSKSEAIATGLRWLRTLQVSKRIEREFATGGKYVEEEIRRDPELWIQGRAASGSKGWSSVVVLNWGPRPLLYW